ncbi:hypothetical protein ACFQO4_19215 [Saliphagus sp. GCM10025334]
MNRRRILKRLKLIGRAGSSKVHEASYLLMAGIAGAAVSDVESYSVVATVFYMAVILLIISISLGALDVFYNRPHPESKELNFEEYWREDWKDERLDQVAS